MWSSPAQAWFRPFSMMTQGRGVENNSPTPAGAVALVTCRVFLVTVVSQNTLNAKMLLRSSGRSRYRQYVFSRRRAPCSIRAALGRSSTAISKKACTSPCEAMPPRRKASAAQGRSTIKLWLGPKRSQRTP
jgi:hypothetical protein